jgi:cytochrome c oxidase subunit 3
MFSVASLGGAKRCLGSPSEPAKQAPPLREVPEYYEHSIWPVLIALATGSALAGFFLLMKDLIIPAGLLLTVSAAAVIGGFLYSDTRNWASTVAKSFGRIPRDSILGAFPVDISLTIQLIILTELLLFGGAFGMYFAIRERFTFWPPAGSPILDDSIARIQTLILISSSILIEWAISQLKKGRLGSFKTGLVGTTILGALFPILQFGFEWPRLLLNGILTPADGVFGATFFLLTGIHGAHVIAGVVAYTFVGARAFMGQYSPKNHGFVEATSTYWHFVHIIWLFLFALLWQGSRILG